MVLSESDVMQALKSVIDPEIGINIVDLGLVYGLDIREHFVKVTMTLTTPGCPMHDSMTMWAEKSLRALDPETNVEINLVWSPRWSPEKMSDWAKNELGY
ncbi:MAG: metal-sulfur cluster assembly factor [Acidobacteriota bacterium]